MSLVLVDYGAGNVSSVAKAFRHLGAEPVVAAESSFVENADLLVLPGVGHFSRTRDLDRTGMLAAMQRHIRLGKPFLGICVGLQWLFAGSEESQNDAGLALWPQTCTRFPGSVRSPHVGWNSLSILKDSRILAAIAQQSYVYFTHSYRAAVVPETIAMTEYGGPFTAALERENVMAVQFHPEKSGAVGLQVLKNFLELAAC